MTFLIVLTGGVTGCATARHSVQKQLMNSRPAGDSKIELAETYHVACPDVIEISMATRSEFDGRFTIGPDGRIPLADYGSLRVEGLTPTEIAERVAKETGTEPQDVRVRMIEYRSQFVTLFGEVLGSQRPVAYHGQETVLGLLQRVGGITSSAEPKQVYVVRTQIGSHQRSDVFHVDLQGIVLNNDQMTNIRVLPFDQIYVGESTQSKFAKSIPEVLKPAYQVFSGVLPEPRVEFGFKSPNPRASN